MLSKLQLIFAIYALLAVGGPLVAIIILSLGFIGSVKEEPKLKSNK
jgi:hypothetical protein